MIFRKRKSSKPVPPKYPLIDGTYYLMPDGKQICADNTKGREEYRQRTWLMAIRQLMMCAMCFGSFAHFDATFDHEAGRGAGKQDDRIEIDGEPINAALCVFCQGIKGSRRFAWQGGVYEEVRRAA